jgi:predicted Zn-dependent protease
MRARILAFSIGIVIAMCGRARAQAPAPTPTPTPPQSLGAKLYLTTHSPEAHAAAVACMFALDNHRVDVAQKRCTEAINKDKALAFAHFMLAEALSIDAGRAELTLAAELATAASAGERLFIDAIRAHDEGRISDAVTLHDHLVAQLAAEPRAFTARARLRLEDLNDLAGAIADLERAVELEPKFAPAYGLLAEARIGHGDAQGARAAAKRYIEILPKEPLPQVRLAEVERRAGDFVAALAAAKRAVTLDGKFLPAQRALGDALLAAGRGKEARRAYGALIGSDDAATHHDGAMREARSWLYEGRVPEAERALASEAALAEKTKRPGDEADALIELGRLQLDRSAPVETAASIKRAETALAAPDAAVALNEHSRRVEEERLLSMRAMVLGAVGERVLAETRANEMVTLMREMGDPLAEPKGNRLRGWVAARDGDDKTAIKLLDGATQPTQKLALALALARAGEAVRARALMESLARTSDNDLEVGLTRPRASAWLKANPMKTAANTGAKP